MVKPSERRKGIASALINAYVKNVHNVEGFFPLRISLIQRCKMYFRR
ncbi:hypothetical protein OL548_20635 [Lysinibacillus sp. MHQ-1]|nr:hypothetical protein OL548_20635 [Lysinibacillus sp. MHQ-1]